MPRLRKPDLSSLTLPQVEMGLQVVAKSLSAPAWAPEGTMLDPASLSPTELGHLSETQWEALFWTYLHLLKQREASPLH
jgi:hypothetical protein